MIVGGTESCISQLVVSGFSNMKALTKNYNENPKESSRPFDSERSGFVISEGAAVLVLEDYNHALKRKAKIHCEMIGYGFSSDAHHISSPSGDGAFNCMKNAISNANIPLRKISLVNAHATSTPLGDLVETNSIFSLFGDHSNFINVTASKGSTGKIILVIKGNKYINLKNYRSYTWC